MPTGRRITDKGLHTTVETLLSDIPAAAIQISSRVSSEQHALVQPASILFIPGAV